MAYKAKEDAIKYNNQFNKEKYDRIGLMVPKGQKSELQAIAAARGMSLNALILEAIQQFVTTEI